MLEEFDLRRARHKKGVKNIKTVYSTWYLLVICFFFLLQMKALGVNCVKSFYQYLSPIICEWCIRDVEKQQKVVCSLYYLKPMMISVILKFKIGKGYNSVGTYCEGWAGNCGEGGKGASSWYLLCDKCREKYMEGCRNDVIITSLQSQATFLSNHKLNSISTMKTNLELNSDIYGMMRENALFLLELSSTGSAILANQKRSPLQQMQMLSEQHDMGRPSTSRDERNNIQNRNHQRNAMNATGGNNSNTRENWKGSPNNGLNRKAESCDSPELIWQIPDVFSCLESLGASLPNESPYDAFGLNFAENSFDRVGF